MRFGSNFASNYREEGAPNGCRPRCDHLFNSNQEPIIIAKYSITQLSPTLVVRVVDYPNRLSPSGKFVENFTKLCCLELTGYRIKYSTVLWLL
jgi:hypothetical protein